MKTIPVIILVSFLFFFCAPAYADGPWKGNVIDSGTKEPIEGAVVLAVWERVYRTPAGDSSYFYEAKEALTDKDGSFEIPSYTPINLLPIISYMRGPEFIIFKPGYGSLQMSLGQYLIGKMIETKEMEFSGKIYRLSPGIIGLPKLKTKEERIEAAASIGVGLVGVPDDKKKKLERLREDEFDYLSKGIKK